MYNCMYLCVTAWPRYRVLRIVDVGQYNLEITSSELSDDSLYECQATEAALRSRRAKLTVLSKNSLFALCVWIKLPQCVEFKCIRIKNIFYANKNHSYIIL